MQKLFTVLFSLISIYCNTCRVSLSYGSPLGSVVIYCAYEMPKQQTQFIKDNLLI